MPLSEEEQRLLQQMERALAAEDPKLASTLRTPRLGAGSRSRFALFVGVFVVGVVGLLAGAMSRQTWLGVAGFVVMVGAATAALSLVRARVVEAEQAPQRQVDPFGQFRDDD